MVRPHPLFEHKKRRQDPWWDSERKLYLGLFMVLAVGGYWFAYHLHKHGGFLEREERQQAAAGGQRPGESGGGTFGSARPAAPTLLAPARRADLAGVLEREGLRVGAVIGLQDGSFAADLLQQWPSCERLYLIDPTGSPGSHTAQQAQSAQEALAPWEATTEWLRMPVEQASRRIADSLDFVYLQASNDYCGVASELGALWPKLRRGGLLAGYNYLTAAEAREVAPAEDWAACGDGSRREGAVKGAVDEFAWRHGLTLAVTYRDVDRPSYVARKP